MGKANHWWANWLHSVSQADEHLNLQLNIAFLNQAVVHQGKKKLLQQKNLKNNLQNKTSFHAFCYKEQCLDKMRWSGVQTRNEGKN